MNEKESLEFILRKFNISLPPNLAPKRPVEIPNIGRDGLALLFAEMGFKIGVEIGVESGEYSEVLCRSIPGVKLFCVDPWKAYRGYRDYVKQDKLDGFYATAQARLAPYDCVLVKKFSMDALRDFPDYSLDFVYIDGNHSVQHVVNDLAAWCRKVRFGGIVSGHDFVLHKSPTRIHVVQAVYAYVTSYEICPWFVLGSQAKLIGTIRDEARSYMWVNAPYDPPRRNRE